MDTVSTLEPPRAERTIYPTESLYEVVLRKSISAQIRQRVLCMSDNEG